MAAVLGQLMTEMTFRVPMVNWADLRGTAPTWLYDFRLAHPDTGLSATAPSSRSPGTAWMRRRWRVLRPGSAPGAGRRMHGGWVEFVHDHRAPWPAWSAEGVAMVFDEGVGVRPAYALERRMAEALD